MQEANDDNQRDDQQFVADDQQQSPRPQPVVDGNELAEEKEEHEANAAEAAHAQEDRGETVDADKIDQRDVVDPDEHDTVQDWER